MTTAKTRQPIGRDTSVQGRRTPHNEPISTAGIDSLPNRPLSP